MMSIEYINQLSRQAGSVANREDRQPRVFSNSADREKNFGRIPNLGHYRASCHGWKLIEHKLVDKSGFGAEDEPALTVRGLNAWMAPYDDVTGVGWAIIEEGQFQVVIGRFENAKLIKEQGAVQADGLTALDY